MGLAETILLCALFTPTITAANDTETGAAVNSQKAAVQSAESPAAIDASKQALVDALKAASGQDDPAEALKALSAGDPAAVDRILAAQIAKNQTVIVQTAELYKQQGVIWFEVDRARAITAFEHAARLNFEDPSTWDTLAYLYVRVGATNKAIAAYRQVLSAVATVPNIALEATTYANLGTIHKVRKEWPQALAMYQKALELQLSAERTAEAGAQYVNIASVLHDSGQLEQALAAYGKALEIARSLDNKTSMASTLGNMGVIYQARQEYDLALERYRQSLTLEQQSGRKQGVANAYGNIGTVHSKRGENAQAREAWQHALAVFTELQSPHAKVVEKWLAELDSVPAQAAKVEPSSEADKASLQAKQVTPSEAAVEPTDPIADATQAVQRWANAWRTQNIDGYLAAYMDGYSHKAGVSHIAWRELRTSRLSKPSFIKLKLSNIKAVELDEGRVAVTFLQHYNSNTFNNKTNKRLVLQKVGQQWLISEEGGA